MEGENKIVLTDTVVEFYETDDIDALAMLTGALCCTFERIIVKRSKEIVKLMNDNADEVEVKKEIAELMKHCMGLALTTCQCLCDPRVMSQDKMVQDIISSCFQWGMGKCLESTASDEEKEKATQESISSVMQTIHKAYRRKV